MVPASGIQTRNPSMRGIYPRGSQLKNIMHLSVQITLFTLKLSICILYDFYSSSQIFQTICTRAFFSCHRPKEKYRLRRKRYSFYPPGSLLSPGKAASVEKYVTFPLLPPPFALLNSFKSIVSYRTLQIRSSVQRVPRLHRLP